MAKWEESKHPRDDDGKFTDKGQGTPAERKRLKDLGIDSQNLTEQSKLKIEEKENYKAEKDLEENVNKILNGTYKGSHIALSNETPKVLQNIGVPNKPLLITAKHAYLAINKEGKYKDDGDHYHNLGKEIFMMIPKLLKSPMMVLQSNKNNDDIIAVLNWYDKEKNILICPIRIGGYGKFNEITIQGNIAKSVYGKKNISNYINKNFNMNDILFAGNKKIRDLHR